MGLLIIEAVTRLFYKKNIYKKMSLKNPKTLRCYENLKKMLGKSPASNAWATIFKEADFS